MKKILLSLVLLGSVSAFADEVLLFSGVNSEFYDVDNIKNEITKMSKDEIIAQLYIGQLALRKVLLKNRVSFCRIQSLGFPDVSALAGELSPAEIRRNTQLKNCNKYLLKKKQEALQFLKETN